MRRIAIYLLLYTFLWQMAYSQTVAPMSEEMDRFTEGVMRSSGQPFFSIWKPYFDDQLAGMARQDSLALFGKESRRKTWFGRKLFQESFLQVDSPGFYLYADPLVDLEKGKESPGENTYVNTRGFRAGARLGRKFALGTTFYENQAHFTQALNEFIDSFRIVPGQGKVHNTQTYGWDYANSSGYLSYSPIACINIQLGQGKHFLGDGHRSLLLSDFSYSYPYARLTVQNAWLMYSWMLAQTDIYKVNSSDNFLFRYNRLGVHVLSVFVGKRVQLSAIQQHLFFNIDTLHRFEFTADMLNPIMMPLFSKKNVHALWGFNAKVEIVRGLFVYNQWMLDNLGGSGKIRKGVQAGWKFFGQGWCNGLFVQGEYNRVEAGAYVNPVAGLNWRNYNQGMAHPYGNHFEEYVAALSWQLGRVQVSGRCGYTQPLGTHADAVALQQSEVSYWDNRYLLIRTFQLTYYLNTKTLLGFTAGMTFRDNTQHGISQSTQHVYVGFRTGLARREFEL